MSLSKEQFIEQRDKLAKSVVGFDLMTEQQKKEFDEFSNGVYYRKHEFYNKGEEMLEIIDSFVKDFRKQFCDECNKTTYITCDCLMATTMRNAVNIIDEFKKSEAYKLTELK